MALIHCPECGKEISDKAPACPNCGAPVATKKVRVHFHRKKSFAGCANTGMVLVDGTMVGSASSGADFNVMLTPGTHNVVIDYKLTGALASGRSSSANIDVPADAKCVDVEIKLKTDAMSFFVSGGQSIVVGEVTVQR